MKKMAGLLIVLIMLAGCNGMIIPTTRGLVRPVDDNFVGRVCPALECDEYQTPVYERMVVVGMVWGEVVNDSPMWWVLSVNSRLLYVPMSWLELICFEGSCNAD